MRHANDIKLRDPEVPRSAGVFEDWFDLANRIVGWATDPRATTTLVLTALNHALRSRDARAGELIHHSDKGAQYTALRFTQRLVDAGIAPRPALQGTATTTPWPRTCGRRSRSNSSSGPARPSLPEPRPSTP